MNLTYAIMGTTTDPLYIDFWPIISKMWKLKFNITPVLGIIDDEETDFFKTEFGLCKKFKRVENINDGLQSQIVRLYLTKLLKGNLIISDIDMLPMSTDFFLKNVSSFSENFLYLLGADNPECKANKEIPMCYIVGNYKKFEQIFKINKEWSAFVEDLNLLNYGWITDQKYAYGCVYAHNLLYRDVRVVERGWNPIASKRIDRIQWKYDDNLVKQNYYIDSHLPRPYSIYKNEIDKLVNLTLAQSSIF